MKTLCKFAEAWNHEFHTKHMGINFFHCAFGYLNKGSSSTFCVEKGTDFVSRRGVVYQKAKWQIIGIKNDGLSCHNLRTRLGVNHTVISRFVQKHGVTCQVKDRPRSGRPRETIQGMIEHLCLFQIEVIWPDHFFCAIIETLVLRCRRQRFTGGLNPSFLIHLDRLEGRF